MVTSIPKQGSPINRFSIIQFIYIIWYISPFTKKKSPIYQALLYKNIIRIKRFIFVWLMGIVSYYVNKLNNRKSIYWRALFWNLCDHLWQCTYLVWWELFNMDGIRGLIFDGRLHRRKKNYKKEDKVMLWKDDTKIWNYI